MHSMHVMHCLAPSRMTWNWRGNMHACHACSDARNACMPVLQGMYENTQSNIEKISQTKKTQNKHIEAKQIETKQNKKQTKHK